MREKTTLGMGVLFLLVSSASAHLIGDADHDHDHAAPRYDFSIKPPMDVVLRSQDVVLLAQAQRLDSSGPLISRGNGAGNQPAFMASVFQPNPLPLGEGTGVGNVLIFPRTFERRRVWMTSPSPQIDGPH